MCQSTWIREMFNKKRICQLIRNFGLEALREEATWGTYRLLAHEYDGNRLWKVRTGLSSLRIGSSVNLLWNVSVPLDALKVGSFTTG